jgi:hypothetical protein
MINEDDMEGNGSDSGGCTALPPWACALPYDRPPASPSAASGVLASPLWALFDLLLSMTVPNCVRRMTARFVFMLF